MEAKSTREGKPRSPLLTKCLDKLRARKSELHARGVLHVAVFGSVARGEDDEKSDVDIIIQVDYKTFSGFGGLFDLEEELSREFGRSVDVVTMGGLKSPKHDHIRREMVLAF